MINEYHEWLDLVILAFMLWSVNMGLICSINLRRLAAFVPI